MNDTRSLSAYGTRVFSLPPNVIASQARSEFDRYKAKETKASVGSFAFHPHHLKRAKTPKELLEIAAREVGMGKWTTLKPRAALYASREALEEAAALL